MRQFIGLDGDSLERWFQDFFSNELGFEDYFPSPGNIQLSKLDPAQSPGNYLEIDGALRINKTCILFEYTNQATNLKSKVKKFTRNCNLFVNSVHLNLREKFELFDIPEDSLDDFEEIENWKFVFLGTNQKFEGSNFKRDDFPDYPNIQESLYIFEPTQIEYFRQLSNLIAGFAKNEFLGILQFTPEEMGDDEEIIRLSFIKADGKYITSDNSIKADVYLFKIKVEKLLRIARVSRYEGIPFILEDDGKENSFQRLLIQRKLNKISDEFINNEKRKTFPNTITLVLNSNCNENHDKLEIPKEFGSIDIIDGQHRLFGYANEKIADNVRKDSEILATAIKFRETDIKKVTKNAARVFVEINSNQAKVKKDLIYLIKYDVLKDKDEVALAGKVILECDKRKRGALFNMFKTSSIKKSHQLNMKPVPITTIIDNDLEPFLKGIGINDYKADDNDFRRVFGNDLDYYSTRPAQLYRKAVSIIEQYFNYVKGTFIEDWKPDANTNLISSKYFSALIRLLRYNLYNENKSIGDMNQVLIDLKFDVDSIVNPTSSPSFPKGNDKIPSTKHGINTIYEFFVDTDSFDSNN